MSLIYDVYIDKYLSLVFQILLLAHCLGAAARNLKSTFNIWMCIFQRGVYVRLCVSVFLLFLFFLFSSANMSSWVGGRARSRQLDCPLLVLLLFRRRNPLHWSLASLLIWGTISPADGSLLKHRKRSELIPISPVIPLLSLNSLISFSQHYSLISHPEHLIFPRTIKHRGLSNMCECVSLTSCFRPHRLQGKSNLNKNLNRLRHRIWVLFFVDFAIVSIDYD